MRRITKGESSGFSEFGFECIASEVFGMCWIKQRCAG